MNGRKYCPHQQWLARKMNLARLEFLDPEKECSSFLKLSKGWFWDLENGRLLFPQCLFIKKIYMYL